MIEARINEIISRMIMNDLVWSWFVGLLYSIKWILIFNYKLILGWKLFEINLIQNAPFDPIRDQNLF